MTDTAAAPTSAVHPFERAGLGLAPFTFAGMTHEVGPIRTTGDDGITMEIGAPGQPMGSCKYCGQGIAIVCHVKSADGKRFTVGSDCIAKLDGKSNRKSKLVSDAERAIKDHRNELAAARREVKRLAEFAKFKAERDGIRAVLAAHPEFGTTEPHPQAWLALNGATKRDYFEWMLANAGATGTARVAAALRSSGFEV